MKTIKQILLALAATVTMGTAQAQTVTMSQMQTTDMNTSRFRTELIHKLPGDVNMYSFAYFYEDGKTYLAKNILSKELYKGIGAHTEIVSSSFATDHVDVGVDYSIKSDKHKLSLKYLPVSVDAEGKVYCQHAVGIGFSSTITAPVVGEVTLSGFGQESFQNKNPQWQYGEVTLSKKVKNFSFGLGIDLTNNKGPTPKVSPHAIVKYTL